MTNFSNYGNQKIVIYYFGLPLHIQKQVYLATI